MHTCIADESSKHKVHRQVRCEGADLSELAVFGTAGEHAIAVQCVQRRANAEQGRRLDEGQKH